MCTSLEESLEEHSRDGIGDVKEGTFTFLLMHL